MVQAGADITTLLYQAWATAVLNQTLVNEFVASQNDPDGRWAMGDRILFGLRSQEQRGDAQATVALTPQFTFYAHNSTQGKPIQDSVEEKEIGDTGFTCQYNGYRALRPGGMMRAPGRQPDIPADPDQCRFFCQNRDHPLSLLNRSPLLQVPLKHSVWNAYYNASPFEPEGHFLWIPVTVEPAPALPHAPQVLTCEFLEDALALFRALDRTILFFNSLHAGASVNHIHVQAVFHRRQLPIERASTTRYRGYQVLEGYPAEGLVFRRDVTAGDLFACIEWLQVHQIPFGLTMVGDRIVLIPRNIEHEIVEEFPGTVLASMGLCGRIITVNRAVFDAVDAAKIQAAFKKLVLPVRSLIDAWAEPQ